MFYAVPLKYLSGYWDASKSIFQSILLGQVLIQGNTHLWFLLTLFFEFVIFYLLVRCLSLGDEYRKQWILWLILFMVCLFSRKIPIKLVSYILEFSIYFYAGMLFECYRNAINARVTVRWGVGMLVLWLALYALHLGMAHTSYLPLKGVKRVDEIMMAFAGMLTFYGAILIALRQQLFSGKWIFLLSRDSLGIYLYSDPLNYVILAGFATVFTISGFGSEGLSAGLYFIRLLFTFLGGLIVTLIIRKIGGIFHLK